MSDRDALTRPDPTDPTQPVTSDLTRDMPWNFRIRVWIWC